MNTPRPNEHPWRRLAGQLAQLLSTRGPTPIDACALELDVRAWEIRHVAQRHGMLLREGLVHPRREPTGSVPATKHLRSLGPEPRRRSSARRERPTRTPAPSSSTPTVAPTRPVVVAARTHGRIGRHQYLAAVRTVLADGAWHRPAEFVVAAGDDRRSATLFRVLKPLVAEGEIEWRGFTTSREYRLMAVERRG